MVIAAITSCTNTSNPAVMVGAGLLARNAAAKGLTRKPWVKTSFAPGSKVVTDYLKACNLLDDLDRIGFNLVGYGCTTCIGNSGPLPDEIADGAAKERRRRLLRALGQPQLRRPRPPAGQDELPGVAAAGRRVRARRHHEPRSRTTIRSAPARTASPSTCATSGRRRRRSTSSSRKHVTSTQFKQSYASVFEGDANWKSVATPKGEIFTWDDDSTYVKHPPYFEGMTHEATARRRTSRARACSRCSATR